LHTSGAIFVNEVATPGTPTFDGGVDYVELFNSGPNLVDLGGYNLTDPTQIFTIHSLTILAAGAFKTYCRGFPESFHFGLSATAERLQFFDSGGNYIFSSSMY
jgi:Lamin Tail Domain